MSTGIGTGRKSELKLDYDHVSELEMLALIEPLCALIKYKFVKVDRAGIRVCLSPSKTGYHVRIPVIGPCHLGWLRAIAGSDVWREAMSYAGGHDMLFNSKGKPCPLCRGIVWGVEIRKPLLEKKIKEMMKQMMKFPATDNERKDYLKHLIRKVV